MLRQEQYLLAGNSDSRCAAVWPGGVSGEYEEFAAVYLELLYFAPHRREQFFPAAHGYEAIEAVLAEDVDGGELFRRTRPSGALDPDEAALREESVRATDFADEDVPESASPGWLCSKADDVARRGNQVLRRGSARAGRIAVAPQPG